MITLVATLLSLFTVLLHPTLLPPTERKKEGREEGREKREIEKKYNTI